PKPESRPEPIKRRFEPSKIPSPIHGYSERKPEPIGKLLEQKDLKEEFHKAIQPQPVQKKQVAEPVPEVAAKLSNDEQLPPVQETAKLVPSVDQGKAEEITLTESAVESATELESAVLEIAETKVEMPEK